MGDFSNQYPKLTTIKNIIPIINKNQTNDTIYLNNNIIKILDLTLLPENIKNVYINNNTIEKIYWNNRQYGTISIKDNNFDCNEINDFYCDELLLDNNNIDNISFNNCVFEKLSLTNNLIKYINFFECRIKKLDLSANLIDNIITLPYDLEYLILANNNITSISSYFENTIKHIDLSNNKLDVISNIPINLKFLNLSDNNFNTFDVKLIHNNLDHFDITNNKIINNNELFKNVKNYISNIYHDTDSESNESNESDESDKSKINNNILDLSIKINDSENISDASSDLSIEMNYVQYNNDDNDDIKINNTNYFNDDDDYEISKTINEYNKKLSSNSTMYNSNSNCNDINDFISSKQINIDFNKHGLMLKNAAMEFRNSMNEHPVKIYSSTIPVKLNWTIEL